MIMSDSLVKRLLKPIKAGVLGGIFGGIVGSAIGYNAHREYVGYYAVGGAIIFGVTFFIGEITHPNQKPRGYGGQEDTRG